MERCACVSRLKTRATTWLEERFELGPKGMAAATFMLVFLGLVVIGILYVVSGAGVLRLGEERFQVRQGMTVYIPMGVEHQTFNTGTEDLCYYWAFAPPPSGPSKAEEQGWKQL